MFILRQLIDSIIIEGIVDDLKRLHPEHADAIDRLARSVPRKLLAWAVDRTVDDNEPTNELVDALRTFEAEQQRLQRRDINAYETLADLRDALGRLGTSKSKQARAAKGDAAVITEDDQRRVLHIGSRAASQQYGKGTRWCISATQTKNYFDHYAARGSMFYFIIDKARPPTDRLSKIAIEVRGDDATAYDATDSIMRQSDDDPERGQAIQGIQDIIRTCISDAKRRPKHPAYDALKSTDVARLRALFDDGMYTTLLLINPATPPDIKNSIIDRMSDEELNSVITHEDIEVDEALLRILIDRGYLRSIESALVVWQHTVASISDDLAMTVLGIGEDWISYVLARCPGISDAVARHIVARGSDHMFAGLAENRAHIKDLATQIIDRIAATNNVEVANILVQSVFYTGDMDVIAMLVQKAPEIAHDHLATGIKGDMIEMLISNKKLDEKQLLAFKAIINRLGITYTDAELDAFSKGFAWNDAIVARRKYVVDWIRKNAS